MIRSAARIFSSLAVALVFTSFNYPQQPTPTSPTKPEALSNADVIRMLEAKLGDDLIISKIKSSPGNFDMSIDDILKLKAAGASDAVVHAMVEANSKAATKEAPPTGSSSVSVKVELKTPVRLILDESLSSKTLKSGDTFQLVAAEDVLVNGRVVVVKGSSATGRITLVVKGNINQPGKIEGSVDSVRAVDGHNIPLEGNVAANGAGMWGRGKAATIEKGQSINCVVAKETEVKM